MILAILNLILAEGQQQPVPPASHKTTQQASSFADWSLLKNQKPAYSALWTCMEYGNRIRLPETIASVFPNTPLSEEEFNIFKDRISTVGLCFTNRHIQRYVQHIRTITLENHPLSEWFNTLKSELFPT